MSQTIIILLTQLFYTKRAVLILIFRWSSSVWQLWTVLYLESELCLDNWNKPIDHYERCLNCLQFASASWVSIYWYLQYCPSSLGLHLIVKWYARLYYLYSQWWALAGFELQTLRFAVTCSTTWAISHWQLLLSCYKIFNNFTLLQI